MNTHPQSPPLLGELLLTFRRKIIESCRKETLPNDLSMPQLEVMSFIGLDGSETMKDIADHLRITPPSVTAMIAQMEKNGMVKRQIDPDDRRRVSIILSKKAKTIYASILQKKNEVLQQMVSRLSLKDKKELERIITILITE
jgi:DNA-binding MarR family transcriptional regulator